jgi:hypothetical protein
MGSSPAAVDEDREPDLLGPTVVEQGVEGGADGSTGVKDVVDGTMRWPSTAGGSASANLRLGQRGPGVISVGAMSTARPEYARSRALDVLCQPRGVGTPGGCHERELAPCPLDDLAGHPPDASSGRLGIDEHTHRGTRLPFTSGNVQS